MSDLACVLTAVDLLASRGLRTWVFGAWGEELRGLVAPCAHADVELLYPGRDLTRLDALDLEWIPARRRPYKRAFALDGVPVEVVLVERDGHGWFTEAHRWPPNVFAASGRLPVASLAALTGYRSSFRRAA